MTSDATSLNHTPGPDTSSAGGVKIVEVESLWVTYGKFVAVRGISFDIPRGEVFGFIGPNGAGKSSTIKVLATLMPKFAGQAKVCGVDVRADPYFVRMHMGYVPDFSVCMMT